MTEKGDIKLDFEFIDGYWSAFYSLSRSIKKTDILDLEHAESEAYNEGLLAARRLLEKFLDGQLDAMRKFKKWD